MATIKDIAQKAGVSIGTVDRVLHDRGMVNPETKARILHVMKELDYHPNYAAQGLAVRKKKLKLCFVIPDSKNHPFYLDIKKAAFKKAEELKQYGVNVIFKELTEIPSKQFSSYTDLFSKEEELDGIVLPGSLKLNETSFFTDLERKKIPYVFYNGLSETNNYLAYIGCNYIDAGKLAAGLSALLGSEAARVCIYSEGVLLFAT